MAYYYGTASQQNTNAVANTDTLLAQLRTAAAGARAYLRKLEAGTYVTPADNAVRLQLQGLDVLGTFADGGAITPSPLVGDAPTANALAFTLPTLGTGTLEPVPRVQLAFNQRGRALWAAFVEDEAIGLVGAAVPNQHIILNSQSTGVSVPVGFTLIHSE